jgi:hypothetical protein
VNRSITKKLKYWIHLLKKVRERKGVGKMETIYCWNTGTLYIVHSPTQWLTAVELEQRLREMLRELSEETGLEIIDVYRVNTGVETERELAERIMNDENCFEVEI